MSELVNTINQNDAVTIQVTVHYGGPWEYQYTDKNTDYKGNYIDGKPHTHAIGFPHELHLITDNWVFRLINVTSNDAGFMTQIDWLQNSTVIHTWTRSAKVEPGKVLTFGDDCIII